MKFWINPERFSIYAKTFWINPELHLSSNPGIQFFFIFATKRNYLARYLNLTQIVSQIKNKSVFFEISNLRISTKGVVQGKYLMM